MAKTGRDLLEDKKFNPLIGQLVDRYGCEQAALIWLDAEKRLDGFLATITDLSPLEHAHAEGFIYPMCSIFLAIAQNHGRDEAEALCAEFMKNRSLDKAAQFQGMLKSPARRRFFLRVFGFAATRAFGPDAGFEQQVHELGGTRLRMDILDCPYVRHCVAAGAPEVAKLFCANDDYAYGSLPGVAFRRTGTIARGADRCDFELSLSSPASPE